MDSDVSSPWTVWDGGLGPDSTFFSDGACEYGIWYRGKKNRPEVSSPLDSDGLRVRDVDQCGITGLGSFDIVWMFLQTSDEQESPVEDKLQATRKRMPSAFRTTHFTSWPHLRSVLVRPRGRNEGTCHSCLRAMWRQRFGTILYCFFRLFAGAYFVSYVK